MSEHDVVNLADEREARRPRRLLRIARGVGNLLEAVGSIGYIPTHPPAEVTARDMEVAGDDFNSVLDHKLKSVK